MEKSAKALTAAALAVLSTQALATGSQSVTPERMGPASVTISTGLTPSDLVVGLDGTLPFNAKAHGLKFACDANSTNVSCTNCNC